MVQSFIKLGETNLVFVQSLLHHAGSRTRCSAHPRGYIYVSGVMIGVYVVQYDGDRQEDYLFLPLYPGA